MNRICKECGASLTDDEIWADDSGSVTFGDTEAQVNGVLCEYCYTLEQNVSGSGEDSWRDHDEFDIWEDNAQWA